MNIVVRGAISLGMVIAAGWAMGFVLLDSHAYDEYPPLEMKTVPRERLPHWEGVTISGARVTDRAALSREKALEIMAERSNRQPGEGVREIQLVAVSGIDPTTGEHQRHLEWWISFEESPYPFGGGTPEGSPTPDARHDCEPDEWAIIAAMNAETGDIGAYFGWNEPWCYARGIDGRAVSS